MKKIIESQKWFVYTVFFLTLILMLIIINVLRDIVYSTEFLISFLITTSFSIGLIFLALIIHWIIKNYQPSKKRIFQITEDEIIIDIPYKDFFQISWPNINKIQVKKEYIKLGLIRKTFYVLIFTGTKTYRKYSILKGWDFRKITINKILRILKEYAENLNKELILQF